VRVGEPWVRASVVVPTVSAAFRLVFGCTGAYKVSPSADTAKVLGSM
jgi:hypothetical protein